MEFVNCQKLFTQKWSTFEVVAVVLVVVVVVVVEIAINVPVAQKTHVEQGQYRRAVLVRRSERTSWSPKVNKTTTKAIVMIRSQCVCVCVCVCVHHHLCL